MSATTASKPPPHYPTPAAKGADLVVHIVGLTLAMSRGWLVVVSEVLATDR